MAGGENVRREEFGDDEGDEGDEGREEEEEEGEGEGEISFCEMRE